MPSVLTATAVLTPEQWQDYKTHFPNNPRIQAVTYDELLRQTEGGQVDWENLLVAQKSGRVPSTNELITPCELAVGYVIFDAVCLALGTVGLRAALNRGVAEAVAAGARPVIAQVSEIIAGIATEGASGTDIAWACFQILKTIWSGGCLGAVLAAFVGSLTWYYALLYGATALATIGAFVVTDGAAFVAAVVIELATFGFLVADSVNAVNVCNQ